MDRENIKFGFGKYKNEYVADVPSDYLNWFLNQDWCDNYPVLTKAADEEINYRNKYGGNF